MRRASDAIARYRAALALFLASALASALLLVASPAFAQTEAQDWAAIQTRAGTAFATYDQERALPVSSRGPVRARRFDAFDRLTRQTGNFIRDYIPRTQRRTTRYAFALFTIALYAEMSGDLWRAHDYYGEVCELAEGTLRPANIAIPTYSGVSVLRLCINRMQRVGAELRSLGRRPTHISILFSEGDEPRPEDFLKHFNELPSDVAEGALTSSLTDDDLMVLRALDSTEDRDACDDTCVAIETARSLALQLNLPFELRKLPHVTVVGIAVDPAALARVSSAMDRVGETYARVKGDDYLGGRPGVFVISGNLARRDASVLGRARRLSPLLQITIAPRAEPDWRIEPDDYPFIYGSFLADFAGYNSPWLDITMLDYPGYGQFSTSNAAKMIKAVTEAAGADHALPFYACPRDLTTLRFCSLHRGMFARFLASLPSRTVADQTALQTAIATSADSAAIGAITGLTTEKLAERFLDFLAQQGSGASPEPGPSDDTIAELKRAFSPATPQVTPP